MIRIINEKREISYEIMRTFACFGVIIIHVFSNYFSLFAKIQLKSWFFANGMMSLARFSVPLFVMITGALLLKKEQTVKKSLHKFAHYLLILILWSAAYIIIGDNIFYNKHIDLKQSLIMFLSNKVWFHLWYLYLLLGIYLILPLISNIVKNFSDKLMKYLFVLFILSIALKMISDTFKVLQSPITIWSNIPMTDFSIGCLLLGYYIDKKINCSKKAFYISLFAFFLSVLITIILTYFASESSKVANQTFYQNDYINILIAATSFFIMMKYCGKHIKNGSLLDKIFRTIGALSLEIYLIHPFSMLFYSTFIYNFVLKYINKLSVLFIVQLILVSIISFIGALIIYLAKISIKYVYKEKLLYFTRSKRV